MSDNLNNIGFDVIGAAFDVRNECGPMLLESYYEAALAIELINRGHSVKRQVLIPATYKGMVIDDGFRADLIVDNSVIIEIKAISRLHGEEFRQLMTYLRLSDMRLGYLINFGAKDFTVCQGHEISHQKGIYRIVNNI